MFRLGWFLFMFRLPIALALLLLKSKHSAKLAVSCLLAKSVQLSCRVRGLLLCEPNVVAATRVASIGGLIAELITTAAIGT